ncbi:MAG: FtsK/SpoIIIE domain-containing protein [Acidimicrobiia bacterium]
MPGVLTAVVLGMISGHPVMAVVSVSAAATSAVVWWADTARRERRRRRETDKVRALHREDVRRYVEAWAAHERRHAERRRHLFPEVADLSVIVTTGDERLWARRPHRHVDAWCVALGRVTHEVAVPDCDQRVTIDDDPRVLEARPGTMIGVHGPLAHGTVRAIVAQLAVHMGPSDWSLRSAPGPATRLPGIGGFPHARSCAGHTVSVVDHQRVSRPDASTVVFVTAPDRSLLPAECDQILEATIDFDVPSTDALARTFDRWRDPDCVVVSDVRERQHSSFAVVIGLADDGAEVWLDIVADGPHAVVVGTTGSGKSELLVRWLTELMVRNDPSQVRVIMVDYKGGATSDRLVDWPHVVGTLTDLERSDVDRVIAALRYEMTERESLLRAAGLTSLGDAPPGSIASRLIVVVDEVAALRARAPGFLDELIDIAQRGRSLGIHLILATQRPRSLGADIVANTDIRIALRLSNPADSVDVVGTGSAATFDRSTPGRAVITVSGSEPFVMTARRTGVTTPSTVQHAPRLWHEALPRRLSPDTPWLAMIDDIEHRRQQRLGVVDGWWLVVGQPGARASVLAAIADRTDVVAVSATSCDAEDVHRLSLHRDDESGVVIDGLDDLVSLAFTDAPSRVAWSRLERRLITAPPRFLVVTASRENAVPMAVRDRCRRVFRLVDGDGGFTTENEGRSVGGRFVVGEARRLPTLPRLPDRVERTNAFAVFADDLSPVNLPAHEPWRLLIIGERGSGRSNAVRAVEWQWNRERGSSGRRLIVVDHDRSDTPVIVDAATDIIVAVDPLSLRGTYDHWIHELRRQRCGLLLGRTALEHADLLGVAPPPRPYGVRPGRGEWVHDGEAMGIVQVTV